MTRQSIRFGKSRFFSMDARVKPAHDDSRMPRALMLRDAALRAAAQHEV